MAAGYSGAEPRSCDSDTAPRLSHVGLYVHDVPKMIDFYTSVLGFVVSDGAEDGRITFLSRNPSDHHQVVLVRGRATDRDRVESMTKVDAAAWGSDSEVATLREVLLCAPDHLAFLPDANAVTRSIAANKQQNFDLELAKRQHREFTAMLQSQGVTPRWLPLVPSQPAQAYTRDSSFMTPWGLVLLLMQAERRRGVRGTRFSTPTKTIDAAMAGSTQRVSTSPGWSVDTMSVSECAAVKAVTI